jgi:arylsulfatase A-like enzyme/Flp pilus assembly protein TadD
LKIKSPLAWAIVAGPIVAVALGVWLARGHAPRQTQPLASGALESANVLLVTIDTLRVDRVGAYGSDRGLTPALDRLARNGLRFDRAYAHVPLTLPSHTTLMTGRYPPHNGVRDNGTFHLSDAPPTLAAALKGVGYRTAAFVGAFVLDARFGLNRGFDMYDDRMLGSSADLDVVQRPAEQVLAPAYDWITNVASGNVASGNVASGFSRTSTPWFAWIHLYDPHEPYTPPEPFRSRYASAPYDGEIAYADAALGAFMDHLQTAGVLMNTLVAVASDHGESLGEHGERTHGLFAYDATLHVPLILWANGRIRPGAFTDTMRLVDVAPTILDLLGAAPLAGADGRSIRPFVAGERPFDESGSYFESLNANFTRGWAPLTGMLRDGLKLIDLPVPELYDLAADPAEERNLYATQRDRARDLEKRLDAVVSGAAPAAPGSIDPDAEARLRSLGYVVGSRPAADRRYTAADDPKTLVHLNQALDDAADRWGRGDAQGAIDELRAVVAERRDLTVAYDRLAFMLRASGSLQEAVAVLDDAAKNGHADQPLLRSLGSMLRDAGDLRRSASVLEPLASGDAADLQSIDALAQTYARMGRTADAEALFRRVLAASPNAAATWSNLGSLYLSVHRVDEAVTALKHAVEINPALATAHNGLGVALAAKGNMDGAVKEWQTALQLRPGYPDAKFNLERARK